MRFHDDCSNFSKEPVRRAGEDIIFCPLAIEFKERALLDSVFGKNSGQACQMNWYVVGIGMDWHDSRVSSRVAVVYVEPTGSVVASDTDLECLDRDLETIEGYILCQQLVCDRVRLKA